MLIISGTCVYVCTACMHRLQWVDSGYAAYIAALQSAQEHVRLCEAEQQRTAELLAPHEAVIATVS
jgi:hypothetical protein